MTSQHDGEYLTTMVCRLAQESASECIEVRWSVNRQDNAGECIEKVQGGALVVPTAFCADDGVSTGKRGCQ